MIKLIFTTFFFLQINFLFSQFGVSAGYSHLLPFGSPKTFNGFHIGGELPKDENSSIYGRISFYPARKDTFTYISYAVANNPLTDPQFQLVNSNIYLGYTVIEGGSRYYIGNGYDSDFGAYGGGNLMAVINGVKRKYEDYDKGNYSLEASNLPTKGTIFNLGVGLGGGVKYTFAGIGTIYLDGNFSYNILAYPSNNLAIESTQGVSSLYSQLNFMFNLGFRKDLY